MKVVKYVFEGEAIVAVALVSGIVTEEDSANAAVVVCFSCVAAVVRIVVLDVGTDVVAANVSENGRGVVEIFSTILVPGKWTHIRLSWIALIVHV